MQKFVPVLEGNLSVKNAPKLSAKYLQDKKMQNQTNAKHSIDPVDIFKSTKNVFEKCSTKEDSSNTTTSKVFSKICNRKNLHSSNDTFPWLKAL